MTRPPSLVVSGERTVGGCQRAETSPTLDFEALSRAGQAADRGGLTKAGRALDKHGNRSGSVFPKAKGTAPEKNAQGQLELEKILSSPNLQRCENRFGGVDLFAPSGKGIRYDETGKMMGFLQPRG